MKKKALQYFFWYMVFVLLCYCNSCVGTRKKALQVETKKEKVKLQEQKDIVSNYVIQENETRITYTPIDPEKPMTLPDGRKTTNATITDEKVSKNSKIFTEDKSKIDSATDKKSNEKNLNVESEKPNPYPIGFIVAGIVAIVSFALYFSNRWIGIKRKKQ